MTEGQSVTAADAREQHAGAPYAAAHVRPRAIEELARPEEGGRAEPPPTGAAVPAQAGREAGMASGPDLFPPSRIRVDARLLEAAILQLRKPIVGAALPLQTPGAEKARATRRKLLSQIDDYLLPRLRESGAPILVALVGSTGAGKSTLVNTLVGAEVSVTGIRRPTTNSPVLACHPGDVDWFAENVFLPTVPRVRQEGLARSGRDGLLVLAASEGMPKGIALLDTPDIDSVVQAHREFAHQFLDASDLWLFMTSASRYADAAVWELLAQAKDSGAALGIVLSRVPGAASGQIIPHFDAMLEANGLAGRQRFVIPETVLAEGRLPPAVSGPVRKWLEETAGSIDRRVAVLTQTMSGVLDTFRTRVPALAADVEAQASVQSALLEAAESGYRAAMAEVAQTLREGLLLRGEVLAHWQDLAGTGDLLLALQSRRRGGRQHQRGGPERARALRMALRTAIESMILSVADRAAEDVVTRWRDHPAGARLLAELTTAASSDGWGGAGPGSLGLAAGPDRAAAHDPARAGPGPAAPDTVGAAALSRSTPDLARRAARAVSAWQDQVLHLVKAENVTKRSIARAVAFDDEALAAVVMTALVAPAAEEGTSAIPRRLLTSLFGAGPLRQVTSRALTDLQERVSRILAEEMMRFPEILKAAGAPDAALAVQLYQATYTLEMVR